MHSKRRYKICICSVILGEKESFRNYKGLGIIFPIILDAIWREIFSDSSLRRIFESENFSFFLGKWNVKIKLQKIVGNLLHKLRKL